MSNQRKFEIVEVNCPDGFVTVQIRCDLVGTIANALRHSGDYVPANVPTTEMQRSKWGVTKLFGDTLSRCGDVLFDRSSAEENNNLAQTIIPFSDEDEDEENKAEVA